MTRRPASRSRRVLALASTGALLLAAAVIGAVATAGAPAEVGGGTTAAAHRAPPPPSAADEPGTAEDESAEPEHPALSPEEIAALPEARYDAVIADLLDAAVEQGEERVGGLAFSLLRDAPLYGSDRITPVARLGAVNFLGEPTVVVPIRSEGRWTLVLTPARQLLPSVAGGDAPAQTAAWIRSDSLVHPGPLGFHIVVDVSAQSLTIVDGTVPAATFAVGIGTPGTPTPHGTGYLQARYLDPAQGQSEHRVQLTSLHSSAADEPYGGSDGGLIGLHHSTESTGSVSHGCIRLSVEAIQAVDALPLGTPITVTG